MTRRIVAIFGALMTLLLSLTLDVAAQTDGRAHYHVFPQVAYGMNSDGSSYQSTLLVSNPPGGSTANCALGGVLSSSITLNPGQWNLYPYSSSSGVISGYASVSCNTDVFATLLYSYNSPTGTTIGEATVFSSPVAANLFIVDDQRGGKRLGLAVANDSDAQQTATIGVYDANATLLNKASRPIPARSSVVGFLDELTGYNGTALAQVIVTCDTGCAAIGLRFSDSVFTTIPAMIINASSPTTPPPDTTPPTISITSPLSGSTVSGNVTVSGTASDNVGVTGVQVRVDSGSFSSATGTNNWTFGIDTTTLSNGSHTVSAQAMDAAGNLSAIATITMNVNNSPPPPAPSSLCSSTPPPPASGIKPFNQTQTEKLCGNWTFTFEAALGSLGGTVSYSFSRVLQNTSSPGVYVVSGTDNSGQAALGGYGGFVPYIPTKGSFWVGLTSNSPTFIFDFIADDIVQGCRTPSPLQVSAGIRCIAMTGTRTH
jgi:hypothetical protein